MFEPWGGAGDAQVASAVAGVCPGPGLAAGLSGLVLADLSDDAVLTVIDGWARMASWASAGQAAAVAELARRRLDGPLDAAGRSPRDGTASEFTADELAVTLHVPTPTAGRLLAFALELDRLPATRQALARGRIDQARAKVITTAVAALPDPAARQVEAQVIEDAAEQTSGQLRAALGRAVLAVDPAAADRRVRRAVKTRKVIMYPDPATGMSRLCADLPGPDAVAVWDALDAAARAGGAGDPRSMDARRADALVRLCTGHRALHAPTDTTPDPAPAAGGGAGRDGQPVGGAAFSGPTRRRVELAITVGLDVLAGLAEQPGELAGYGPITAQTARALLAQAEGSTHLALTDPTTGMLLALSPPHRYDPATLPRTRAHPPDEDDDDEYDDSWLPNDWPPKRNHPPDEDWPPDDGWPPDDEGPPDDDDGGGGGGGSGGPPGDPPEDDPPDGGGGIAPELPEPSDPAWPDDDASESAWPDDDASEPDGPDHRDADGNDDGGGSGYPPDDRDRASSPARRGPVWRGLVHAAHAITAARRRAHAAATDPDTVAALLSTVALTGEPGGLDEPDGPGRPESPGPYRVPAAMARYVRNRDRTCRFPGCRQPARRCDIDHGLAWPAGPTHPTNLACLCRRHHRLKQTRRWHLRLHPNGTAIWIGPTGQVRLTRPPHAAWWRD